MTADTREIELNRTVGELAARQNAMAERIRRMEQHMEHMENTLDEIRQMQRVLRWILGVFTAVSSTVAGAVVVSLLT